MDNDKAKEIIQTLADGIDPDTGEILPKSSPYQSAPVIRALHAALKALEHKTKSDARRKKRPEHAGKSWSKEEDQQVSEAFDKGETVTEIANIHKRTRGAIQSRLEKLGKIEMAPEFENKTEFVAENNEKFRCNDDDKQNTSMMKPEHGCIDCGSEIPEARLKAIPGVTRCSSCQEKIEKRNPASFERKVDEGLAGTREDHKRMQGKQFSDMRRRNYE